MEFPDTFRNTASLLVKSFCMPIKAKFIEK